MTEEAREDAQDLEPVGIVDEIETKTARRIESLTNYQTYTAIVMFVLSNILILCVMFFGPSLIVMQPYEFAAPINAAVRSKKFTFEFSGFHVFHAFMAIDLVFEKNKTDTVEPFNVSISRFLVTNIHSTKNESSLPTQVRYVRFPPDSEFSDRLRIWDTTVVDFSDLHSWVALKYAMNSNGTLPQGRFEWFYGDPAHSVVQVFLRFVFFVIAILLFVRLMMSDFDLKSSHVSMRLMFFLDLFLIVGSNPFYILTFFTKSKVLRVFDAVFTNFLLQCCLFTAFAVLIMGGLTHRDASFSWIAIRFVPFGLIFIVFAIGLSYYHSLIDTDPLGKATDISFLFVLVKAVVAAVYFVCFVIAALAGFKTEIPNEKRAMISLGLVFFFAVFIAEAASTFAGYIELKFANQIFTLMAIGTYIIFFNYINWPTDISAAVPESENVETGTALAEDLAAEM